MLRVNTSATGGGGGREGAIERGEEKGQFEGVGFIIRAETDLSIHHAVLLVVVVVVAAAVYCTLQLYVHAGLHIFLRSDCTTL